MNRFTSDAAQRVATHAWETWHRDAQLLDAGHITALSPRTHPRTPLDLALIDAGEWWADVNGWPPSNAAEDRDYRAWIALVRAAIPAATPDGA